MTIKAGDVYWVQLDDPTGKQTHIPHPHVIIQRIDADTLLLCAITSNRKKASLPGNVLLEAGEANLPRISIVEVSKTLTIPHAQLGDYIGTLSEKRLQQIAAGRRLVERSFLE